MKTRLSLLVIIFFIGWSSCTNRPNYPLAMQEAKSCMNSHPDSALYILKTLADSISSFPEETQMYYHLLCIQAKDKQYIEHTDDSLINCIVEFYEDYDNAEKQTMAYYYQGSVYRDMNDSPRALKAYQQAVDVSTPNNELLPKIYSQMGNLFAYQGLYDESIEVNRKFIDFYVNHGEPNKISYALRDIARMYDVKEITDSALYYYKKASETALHLKDSANYYNILSELGGFYYEIGEESLAKEILLKIQNKPQIINKAHVYPFLGYIYTDEQKWDSAYYYFHKTLEEGDVRKRLYTYYDLAQLEAEIKHFPEAIDYMNQYVLIKDSIDKITKTETIAKINSLYNYQHTEKENNELKLNKEKQKIIILILTLSFIVIIVISVLFFNFQKRKNRKKIEHAQKLKEIEKANYERSLEAINENNKKIANLNTQLKETKKKNEHLQHELILIQKEKLELCNKKIIADINEQELKLASFQQSSIFFLLQRAAASETIVFTDEDWERFTFHFNFIYPNFTERLYRLQPQLTSIELRICYLTKLSFSPANIARILLRSKSAITNARVRLHKKIHKTSGSSEEFDKFIKNL